MGAVRKSELSEPLFCKLMGRIFAMQGEGLPAATRDQARGSSERFARALRKALPTVAPDELYWRMHFMVGAMIQMLVHPEALHRLTQGASGTPTLEATLSRFVRFAAAGLREGEELAAAANKGPQAMFDF